MKSEIATFAGECHYCLDSYFREIHGVEKTSIGYMGGEGEKPTWIDYKEKGYSEVLQIIFNPEIVSYKELLTIYWQILELTNHLSSPIIIFYHNEQQKQLADASKKEIEAADRFPLSIEIRPATTYYQQ